MVFSAVVLTVSIVVASLLAALISREAIKHLFAHQERALKAAVIGTLVDAATEASVWNSLTPQEQVLADRAVGQADVQLRLLPIKGSGVAANWAAHQLGELKRTSATFGYQLEPTLLEFRDRLVEWQEKPGRTRKIFQSDLDRWKVSMSGSEKNLLAEQDAWTAQQHHDHFGAEPAAPVPATSLPAAPLPATPVPAPLQYASGTTSPSTETQRLLDDVQALEVRPTPPQS